MNSAESNVGLCGSCVHGHIVPHPRGGLDYRRCALHDTDPAFPKYPHLPVHTCSGYARTAG